MAALWTAGLDVHGRVGGLELDDCQGRHARVHIRKFLADLTCNQVYVDMYFVTVTCTMLHVNNKNSNRGRFVMRIKTFSHVNPICYMSTCNHESIVYVMYMLHVSYIYMLVVMHVDFIEACRQ